MPNIPLESFTEAARASAEHGTHITAQKWRHFTTSLGRLAEERCKLDHKVKLSLEEDIERALNVINLLQETNKSYFNAINALNDTHLIVMPPLVRLLEERSTWMFRDSWGKIRHDKTRVEKLNDLDDFSEDGGSG